MIPTGRDRIVKEHIGSSEGLGEARLTEPMLNISIFRKVLTRDGDLADQEVALSERVGSGLGSVVYKGIAGEREVAEKFFADLPLKSKSKRIGKKVMEGVSFVFKQAPPSYRTNFYAAMTAHYMSLIIERASVMEFGECIVPRLQYTAYDPGSGGYVMAYEYINGRPVRFRDEEGLLKERLREWRGLIGDRLGFWGLARQCDAANINSPGNVLIVDEDTKKMKLIDVTPAVLGGQIWLLPFEFKYFFKGLLKGEFLPFGDAVDMKRFAGYCARVAQTSSQQSGDARLSEFKDQCEAFKFYLGRWRDSEPAALRSPLRIFRLFLDIDLIRSVTLTSVNHLEHAGVISVEAAAALRERARAAEGRFALSLIRVRLITGLCGHVVRGIPVNLGKAVRFFFVRVLGLGIRSLGRALRCLVKIYVSREYRQGIAREKIREWIDIAELKHRSIAPSEARELREECGHADVLEIIEIAPLWSIAKIVKPPFVGTVANFTLLTLFMTTGNAYLLIPLFADGVIRFLIALLFTGIKYKTLLILSVIPSFGFILPIPAQLMKSFPRLSEFLLCEVIGSRLGTCVPGVDRHSFRTYFYMRLMRIFLLFFKPLSKGE